jgi:hypothetical protein
MSKTEKLKLSHSVIEWLSQEITEVDNVIRKLKNNIELSADEKDMYDIDDLDYLENKLEELNQRSVFEAKNLKKLRMR